MTLFDRSKMRFFSLASRKSKVEIVSSSRAVEEDKTPIPIELQLRTRQIAEEILVAKKASASVILAFGAHTIKNSLGVLLIEFLQRGWLTHLATNGAGVIHDWEFAFQGKSSEDVRENVDRGKFGTWKETGLSINLALAVGSYEGLGYGESVGALISRGGLQIPLRHELIALLSSPVDLACGSLGLRAAAADLLALIEALGIPSGWYPVRHKFPGYSVQAAAFEAGVPFTSHPMFGCDIIYTHPANHGALIGRTAERDFLSFAQSVSRLEGGGVYLSVGSAVMSPMIFEKSLSMARNVAQQHRRDVRNCHIHVVDLAESSWDWSGGEPPMDNPAYYHRFMKTFHRMGCPLDYTSTDNRLFFLSLYRHLNELDPPASETTKGATDEP